ncbi:MFS transporter [Candidatus Parcubacteria bacterium]|nr:MAG: MFS transporter [Candidatus Parcubacteria bacterium]
MSRKILPILFATLLLDMVGLGMLFPIIPVIFTDPSSPSFLLQGYSQSSQYLIAGIITALFGLFQFFAAPIVGELSDVYGRKRILTAGVGVLAIAQFLFGFGIMAKMLWLLILARALSGIAGANLAVAQATIADITEPKDRAKNFGLIGGAFGIGFILGPILGGLIAEFTGSAAAPFWFAGLLGIVNTMSITLFLPETRKERSAARSFHMLKGIHNLRAAWRDRDARPVYITNFLYFAGFAFFTSFIGILLINRFGFSEAGIGTFFGIVGAWVTVTQLFILRILVRKYSERSILYFTMPIIGFFFILYPFLPNTAYLYAIIPLVAIPQGLTMANLGALVSKSVSPDEQGAALGINASLLAFSQGLIPFIAGVGSGALGIQTPFIAAGILAWASWLVLFVLSRR